MADCSADDDDGADDEAAAAAEALMASVQRGFAAAKKAGVPAATRVSMKLCLPCVARNIAAKHTCRPHHQCAAREIFSIFLIQQQALSARSS